MDSYLTRGEHEEFRRGMETAHDEMNRRLDALEEMVKQIGELTTTVGKLATGIESMAREQKQQGKKLAELEGRDGEMWRKVTGYIVTTIISIVIGFVFAQIGT